MPKHRTITSHPGLGLGRKHNANGVIRPQTCCGPGREILALDHIGVEPGVDVLCRVWALRGNGAPAFAQSIGT
jgi:hypothetical protein